MLNYMNNQSLINSIKQSTTYSKVKSISMLQVKIWLTVAFILTLCALYAFHTLFIKFIDIY